MKIEKCNCKRADGLTDIPGILVGTAEDESGRTGCTAIICPKGAIPGVSVVGGNPGTMETDAIRPGTREDGMARAISPIHTQWDGDTVFCLATGSDTSYYKGDAAITVVGTAAAVVLEKAIIRGALAAQ